MSAARDKKPGFDSEFNGSILRIKLRGEIDHHSAVAVRSAIDDMIRSKRPAELVIDMSAVDFMDSSGLGLIMGRYNTMREIGGRTTVADPNPGSERIIRLAGLERIVRIVHTSPVKSGERNNAVAGTTSSARGQRPAANSRTNAGSGACVASKRGAAARSVANEQSERKDNKDENGKI